MKGIPTGSNPLPSKPAKFGLFDSIALSIGFDGVVALAAGGIGAVFGGLQGFVIGFFVGVLVVGVLEGAM